jgi:hypothetical protein
LGSGDSQVDYLLARIADPFFAPLDPSHRLYWLYLCTALALALAVFIFTGKRAWARE